MCVSLYVCVSVGVFVCQSMYIGIFLDKRLIVDNGELEGKIGKYWTREKLSKSVHVHFKLEEYTLVRNLNGKNIYHVAFNSISRLRKKNSEVELHE